MQNQNEVESIETDWDVQDEARFFVRLVRLGKMTPDQVEDNMRMSGKDVRFLRTVVADVVSAQVVEALRVRREQTWEAFQKLIQ